MKIERVIEFAISQGYDRAEYLGKWRSYDVYEPMFSGDEVVYVGPPLVILVNGETIRMSTVEEAFQQLDEM